MAENFNSSWINVLDEIITEWFNKYAPGFMCVGRKPNTLSNEGNTICCGSKYRFSRSQIVEGKDFPGPFGQKEYNELGKH